MFDLYAAFRSCHARTTYFEVNTQKCSTSAFEEYELRTCMLAYALHACDVPYESYYVLDTRVDAQ